LGSIDPGKDKDVGWSTTELLDSNGDGLNDQVIVTIGNAYPSYSCEVTATVLNSGTLPVRITSVDVTTPFGVTVSQPKLAGVVLNPGQQADAQFLVHVEQEALQSYSYTFTIKITANTLIHGTIGFWKNCCKHKTFSCQEIEEWLAVIDETSLWLGPTTIEGMKSIFDSASRRDHEAKFLGHYLATRLNAESGVLDTTATHNVTIYDPDNYLGLTDPNFATLAEIILAIESKFGTALTKEQFEIMKNICDGLNNLWI
jgi:hypothetical protein